jgi:hypothetical protein
VKNCFLSAPTRGYYRCAALIFDEIVCGVKKETEEFVTSPLMFHFLRTMKVFMRLFPSFAVIEADYRGKLGSRNG